MSITDGKLKLIISDFDGVFTDNYVWTDSNGNELVKTSRSDSFSISNFKNFVNEMKIELDFLILSTETNSVVTSRAQKLGLKAICGVVDKKSEVQKILHERKLSPDEFIFLGNDLNDYPIFDICENFYCPSDAHPRVKEKAKIIFSRPGGDGFIREVLEFLMGEAK